MKALILWAAASLAALSPRVYAIDDVVIDAVEKLNVHLTIAWIGFCAALLVLMWAGLLLRELGLVRSKNAISVIMKSVTGLGVGSLGYWFVGFGFMFGANSSGWLGTSYFLAAPTDGLSAVNLFYHLVLATMAAGIVAGALSERVSFLPFVGGAVVITTIIYPVFGAWAWGGEGAQLGWLRDLGFHDAAGATVVHSIGGWCALGATMVLGPREGRFSRRGEVYRITGHNIPLTAIGSFIVWVAWFGLAGGRIAGDFEALGIILLNTHLGAIGGMCGVIAYSGMFGKDFYAVRIMNGGLAGLVAVSAGVDVLGAHAAVLVGFVGGIILCVSGGLLHRSRVDDVVSAIPIHGFAGAWGTFAVGIFYAGDMFNLDRVIVQMLGVFVAFVWGVSSAYVVFWLIDKLAVIRVPSRIEQRGLDLGEHKEIAYGDFVTTDRRADL